MTASSMFARRPVRALLFDVFGTCVDWRGGVIRAAEAEGAPPTAAAALADAWRGLYQPAMEEVRSGRRPFTKLDVLHRESLDRLLPDHGLGHLEEAARCRLNLGWHRLDPWPDTAEGLRRLRQRFVLATLSNGNVSLLVDLARFGDLRYDTILSAELVQAYKPQPEAYLRACAILDVAPAEAMMVAAHPDDLEAARSQGLGTAYVSRPLEFGRPDEHRRPAPQTFDFEAGDMIELGQLLA